MGIHLVSFIVFASLYSPTIHEIRYNEKLIKLEKIDSKKIKSRIINYEYKIKRDRKYSYFSIVLIFIVNLIFVFESKFTTTYDYLYATIVFLIFLGFLFFVYWLNGYGTIDTRRRLLGGNEPLWRK